MLKNRRFALIALVATLGIAIAGVVVGIAVVRASGSGTSTAIELRKIFRGCPKAVLVGPRVYEIGVIDKPGEYTHDYVIRNEGNAPLELQRGPSTCSCTLTGLPENPIPPGGEGKISIGFNDSHKNDVLKPGPLDRGVTVYTNDPENENILLGLIATVRRRVAVNPELLNFSIHASDQDADQSHSAKAIIYSQTWERFELTPGNCALKGVAWAVEPASADELKSLEARSGYRICVTLPPAMPDGRFSSGIEFDAKPDAGESQSLRIDFQGAVDGHLSWFGEKVQSGNLGSKVLMLGTLSAGNAAKETSVMKINCEPKSMAIKAIETEPSFLRARVVPLGDGSAKSGVFRVEVEIPRDAPLCNHMEQGHLGCVRIVTDHPRFSTIELKVFFSVVSGK